METIPLEELHRSPSQVTARVRAGATLVVTDHGTPVIRMSPAAEPVSVLGRLAASGRLVRSAHPGAVPELIDDPADLPLPTPPPHAARNRERTR
ncbi:prevent-host-death protein [Streptomyces sodiiphilus]